MVKGGAVRSTAIKAQAEMKTSHKCGKKKVLTITVGQHLETLKTRTGVCAVPL